MEVFRTGKAGIVFRWIRLFTFVVALPCFLLLSQSIPSAHGAAWQQGPPSFADLAEQVKHAVVNISTTQVLKESPMQQFMGPNSPFRDFFDDDFMKRFFGEQPQGQRKGHALGSGFIIDQSGLILTNNHVVEKADEIKIKTLSGKEYDAKVVGRDSKTDIALIKVTPDTDFPKPAQLGNSDAIRVGDWVMAVGNPFALGHTVTAGIISAKGRVIGAGPYDDFLQTDAAINPGNSGGPLFNMNAEVVGLNTAIVAHGQGIGFATPINVAKDILEQLKSGKVVRGWLGVMIQDITPELAESFGIKETKGVIVADVVPDAPAEAAGIKRGDVITSVNGKEIDNAPALSRYIGFSAPGTPLSLQIIRDGKPMSIKVSSGTMPDEGKEAKVEKKESLWGMVVQNITPEIAQRFGWDENERGVVITEVKPGSPAGEARLRPGDLIKEVNRQKIQNIRDYNQAVQKPQRGQTMLLLVKRGKNTFFVSLKSTQE
ncbi:DegQ family serine endoprotease [Syntrophobacter fumaroxidans]|uniref:Probable periplasmic serine endoprotease DegP-like n=1 Tax=Syntrophobacter fumaroxidans (strain DSM 10017 / MPOB) TaxID=335543 RepID=A0LGX7_SYNFM|nr:DegQ family serine endoprotease [Syntrophobacter fumaroxidans]ABK16679.1 protease Do [Syntrophobacter fumaroxidans MPOB]